MNDKNLITVLQAKIAQLTVALDDAERNNSAQQVARMEDSYRRQREDDKAYYEQRLEAERQQHKEEMEALRQEMRELREENKRQMQVLIDRLAQSDHQKEVSQLTAEEQKALARFRQKQKYKRSTEQRNLLNRREKEQSREEEKDNWDGTNPGAGNASGNTSDIPADAPTTPSGKKFRNHMSDAWETILKTANYWMIDETPGLVGCEKDGIRSYFKRYFWGIKAKALKLCWFLYENGSRGLKAIKPYLDQFIGFFTTDGYVVYKAYEGNDTPNQTRSACLTHIRRDFVNSLEENRELSYWFIDIFGKLFGLEYEYKKRNLTPEERLAERNSDKPGSTKRLMSLFWQRLKEFHESGYKGCGQLMTKALRYAYNEWKAMEMVLKNGAVELSNNLAEQMMRHIKQNLKNSMNIGSEEAALDNAFMYSLIESCRMNNLSPVDYIRHLTAELVTGQANKRQLLPCFCKI